MVRVRLVMLGGGVLIIVICVERIKKVRLGGGVLLLGGSVLLLGERLLMCGVGLVLLVLGASLTRIGLVLLVLGAGLMSVVRTSSMSTRRAVVVARRSCMIAVVVRCGAGGWVGWVHAAPTVESIGLILLCLGIHCHLKPVNYLLGRGFWGGDQMVQVLSFIAKHSHLKDKKTRDPGVGQ